MKLQSSAVHQIVAESMGNRDGLLPKHPLFRAMSTLF